MQQIVLLDLKPVLFGIAELFCFAGLRGPRARPTTLHIAGWLAVIPYILRQSALSVN